MKRLLALLMAVGLLACTLTGCSEANNLVIGTASSTGTYYYVGAAIGNSVSDASELNVMVQATAGSNENVALVLRTSTLAWRTPTPSTARTTA